MKIFLFLLALLCAVSSAQAEDFLTPSYPNLIRTMVRFRALDMRDDNLLDDFALITECSIYSSYFNDDFKWNKVRGIIRESIRQNIPTFPTGYSHMTTMRLGRYDFKKKIYPFANPDVLRNVNSLSIYSSDGLNLCNTAHIKYFPLEFRVVLETSVYLDGLPLSPEDAETLTHRMEANNNLDRMLYVKFNMNITYVEPVIKNLQFDRSGQIKYTQGGKDATLSAVRLDAHLSSINFYEDKDLTRLVYSYSF